METFAMSPRQFQMSFRTETQCMKFLFSLKFPDGFSCRRCKHTSCIQIATRKLWECKSCGYQESAKSGTLFHKSKVSLVNWFAAIYEFTIARGGIAATELQERLSLGSYRTAWAMLHKLRIAMLKREENYRLDTGGQDDWIELDGAYFGKKAKHTQAKAYVAVEARPPFNKRARSGFVKVKTVPGLSRASLNDFTEQNIEPSARVRTDGGLEISMVKETSAVAFNQQVMGGNKAKQDQWLLHVNRTISNMKTALQGVYHGVSSKYLGRYLSEYAYRTNRRWWRSQIQIRLLNACVATHPVTFAEVCA